MRPRYSHEFWRVLVRRKSAECSRVLQSAPEYTKLSQVKALDGSQKLTVAEGECAGSRVLQSCL